MDLLCMSMHYFARFDSTVQIGIENPQAAVTFLDYSCSGASIDAGILGPQDCVERESWSQAEAQPTAIPISGDSKDSQIYQLLRELCVDEPERQDDLWTCP